MRKVVIKGKEYPAHTTMGAMLRFKQETGRDVSQLDGAADVITFMWCCIVSACNASGVEFGMDLQTFADSLGLEAFEEFNASALKEAEGQKKTQTGANE